MKQIRNKYNLITISMINQTIESNGKMEKLH
jgi:hypothetical protein